MILFSPLLAHELWSAHNEIGLRASAFLLASRHLSYLTVNKRHGSIPRVISIIHLSPYPSFRNTHQLMYIMQSIPLQITCRGDESLITQLT